jgi:hypothetical protein
MSTHAQPKRHVRFTALVTVLFACTNADSGPVAPAAERAAMPTAQAALNLGYGPDLFYYLRHDATNNFSTFGTISTAGVITDRFGVGTAFNALTFAAPNVGYGANLFYYLRQDLSTGFTTLGTISTNGTITDRFGVGQNFDALVFVPEDVGYGVNLFYYLRHDPATGFSTFGTISTNGTITDRYGVGSYFRALAFADVNLGYGANQFYYLRLDLPASNFTTFGTISTDGTVTDRFGVGDLFDALVFARPLAVSIDIKPGVFPNTVNPGSKGKLPVAILSTATFDATTVNAASVRFGVNGSEAVPVHVAQSDVNADGRTDLILQFLVSETGIVCGTTSGVLTAQAGGGAAIQGTDSIMTTGCN